MSDGGEKCQRCGGTANHKSLEAQRWCERNYSPKPAPKPEGEKEGTGPSDGSQEALAFFESDDKHIRMWRTEVGDILNHGVNLAAAYRSERKRADKFYSEAYPLLKAAEAKLKDRDARIAEMLSADHADCINAAAMEVEWKQMKAERDALAAELAAARAKAFAEALKIVEAEEGPCYPLRELAAKAHGELE